MDHYSVGVCLWLCLFLCLMAFCHIPESSLEPSVFYGGQRKNIFGTLKMCERLCYTCVLSSWAFHILSFNSLLIMKQVHCSQWTAYCKTGFFHFIFFSGEVTLKLVLPPSRGEFHAFGRTVRSHRDWIIFFLPACRNTSIE